MKTKALKMFAWTVGMAFAGFLIGSKPRQQAGTFGETSYRQLSSWPASVYFLAGFSRARIQSSPLPALEIVFFDSVDGRHKVGDVPVC
jgi:hypothetical protein